MKKVIIWIAVITLLASSFAPVISILLSPAVPTEETNSGIILSGSETGTSTLLSTGTVVSSGTVATGASLSGKVATGVTTPKKVIPPIKPKTQSGTTVKKPVPKKVVSGETK
jgi:hypothetical protein